jgi:hypothetical protein
MMKKIQVEIRNLVVQVVDPRLQSGFFRTQVMVYETSHEPSRNEIEFMLSNCQSCID